MYYLYLGPGVGGGVLAVIIGVVILILITIFTFLWFPIKRYLKKRKKTS